MTAVILLSPKPGTKGASRLALAERSRREPNTLFLVVTASCLTRGGTIERASPLMIKVIGAIAARAGYATVEQIAVAVWGDREDGGPATQDKMIDVLVCKHREALETLGVSIIAAQPRGRRLILHRIVGRSAKRPIVFCAGTRSRAHWLPQAMAMAERGATIRAIAEAVGRSPSTVGQALSGRRYDNKGGRRTASSAEARQRGRDRQEARKEAERTGERVEAIYARWGCEKVDRSRLWDQRRAAASEARQ